MESNPHFEGNKDTACSKDFISSFQWLWFVTWQCDFHNGTSKNVGGGRRFNKALGPSHVYDFFPASCVSPLRGSYSRSQGRGWIRMRHLLCGIFPGKFRVKLFLSHVHRKYRPQKPSLQRDLGARHFSWTVLHRLVFWHVHVHIDFGGSCKVVVELRARSLCLFAFRLRLAQSGCEILFGGTGMKILPRALTIPGAKILWRS